MEQIRANVEAVTEKAKGFAVEHKQVVVTGAVITGGVIGAGIALSKMGLTLITVAGVIAVTAAGASAGKVLAEAALNANNRPEYLPPPIV